MRSPFILAAVLVTLLALVSFHSAAVQESRFCLQHDAAPQSLTGPLALYAPARSDCGPNDGR
jgi:hypothetical protein